MLRLLTPLLKINEYSFYCTTNKGTKLSITHTNVFRSLPEVGTTIWGSSKRSVVVSYHQGSTLICHQRCIKKKTKNKFKNVHSSNPVLSALSNESSCTSALHFMHWAAYGVSMRGLKYQDKTSKIIMCEKQAPCGRRVLFVCAMYILNNEPGYLQIKSE